MCNWRSQYHKTFWQAMYFGITTATSTFFGFCLTGLFFSGDHSRFCWVTQKTTYVDWLLVQDFSKAKCPSSHPTNSVTALNGYCISLRFNGHFPGERGLAGVYWSKGWWRWWWQLDYWSYKLCKAPVKSSPPSNKHRVFFYRPDALPVAQPTVSKHWRKWRAIASHCYYNKARTHTCIIFTLLSSVYR